MRLSVIIVSYNVWFFLEQCLLSVQKAMQGMDAEVIAIDNHSSDGTHEWLPSIFPSVQFVFNTENTGFARACNQGLKLAKGEWILFLNPDTLVPEDCFKKNLAFINDHPHAGAIGVRMLDGKGRFLPESKRAFPSPGASFFKLTGLASIFPRSGFFNRYALGQLDPNIDHEVEVLAGAFLLARKTVLDELNGFDERFFLYGEDIDLSFRIRKAGYHNLYFAGTEIVHFKGESSAASRSYRLNFFYEAMVLFIQKHYPARSFRRLAFLLRQAVGVRAAVSRIAQTVKPLLLPLIDVVLVWIALQATRTFWITRIRHGVDFHVAAISYALPAFAFVFTICGALAGLYDKQYKTSRTLTAAACGLVAVLALYSVLPESIRFSRGVVLTGVLLGSILVLWFRQSLFIHTGRRMGYEWELKEQTLVAGSLSEYNKVMRLFADALQPEKLLGRIAPAEAEPDTLGTLDELPRLLQTLPVDEIVFCEGTLRITDIINEVRSLSRINVRILYHLSGSHSLVGSDLPSQRGRSISTLSQYRLAHPYQRRMKRLVDVFASVAFFIITPLHFLLHPAPIQLLRNSWQVLTGSKTWVGYRTLHENLPMLRPGVIYPINKHSSAADPEKLYARNYDWWQDLRIIFSRYRGLA